MNARSMRPTWRMKAKRKWSDLRSRLLEHRADVGLGGPPNNWAGTNIYIERPWGGHAQNISADFNNDAGEIFIRQWWTGEEGDMRSSFDVRAFRQLALWYLWRWAWGEWFGLRRRLFYWDLGRRLKRAREMRGNGWK